jgi:hypothetical protein
MVQLFSGAKIRILAPLLGVYVPKNRTGNATFSAFCASLSYEKDDFGGARPFGVWRLRKTGGS